MAWQEVTTLLKASPSKGPRVTARCSESGGVTLSLTASLVASLGWQDNAALALLVGSAESEGRIALKPRGNSLTLRLTMHTPPKGGQQFGRVRVGRFSHLTVDEAGATEVSHETKNDQLIITLPDGWLRAAA